MRNKRQLDRARIRCNDRVVEVDYGFVVFIFNFQGVSFGEFIQIVDYFDFAVFRYISQIIGQLIDYFFFLGTNFVDIGFRFVEDDIVFSQRFGFFDNFCYVQQCFRRDIVDVQVNIVKGVVTFYDYGFQI